MLCRKAQEAASYLQQQHACAQTVLLSVLMSVKHTIVVCLCLDPHGVWLCLQTVWWPVLMSARATGSRRTTRLSHQALTGECWTSQGRIKQSWCGAGLTLLIDSGRRVTGPPPSTEHWVNTYHEACYSVGCCLRCRIAVC